MCGRYAEYIGPSRMRRVYELSETPRDLVPRFNIAPSQSAAVVREGADHERTLAMLHWGLIPPWARDLKSGPHPINARAETAHERPMFRKALRVRRCLVPASGFYEWKKVNGAKRPYFCRLRDEEPFGMAGLWEHWHGPDGEDIESFTILTTDANDLMAELHDRMPVIVDPADYAVWLDPEVTDPHVVEHILRPFPADRMEAYPVSPAVNNPKHDDPSCIERL
jgi:putative SOS response-associated peptidase YedK